MDKKLNDVIYEFERVTGKAPEEVAKSTEASTSFGFVKKPRFNFESLTSPKFYYVYLPVIILVSLLALRPMFLYIKKDGKSPVFSFTKLVAFTVIFSIMIIIAYYVFQYQMKM